MMEPKRRGRPPKNPLTPVAEIDEENPSPLDAALKPKSIYPPHWIKGQLIDVKRFSDNTYQLTLAGENYDPELNNGLTFTNSYDAQAFLSTWYMPDRGRFG